MHSKSELNGIFINVDDQNSKLIKKNFKKKLIIISIISLIIIISIVLVFICFKKNEKDDKPENHFEVLMTDEKINKSFTSNITTEIIQLENGLKTILISELNSSVSSIGVLSPFGSSLDIIPGLAHFSEHMAFRGSKNYRDNKYWTGFSYQGIINDACTFIENTYFYFTSTLGYKYETFLDIFSDFLHYPKLDSSVIPKEINVVNSEYLRSNISDDFILHFILMELTNKNHPIYNGFGVGNNITLTKISPEQMSKYLRAYFQHAFNPVNLTLLLSSNKSISDLEKLAVKYFNYNLDINETIGNEERNKKRQKIKEERIFNKENGAKILKFYSKISANLNIEIINLLVISFGINDINYKDGFNPIDFIQYLFYESKNISYLMRYLSDNDYIYAINPKIYYQFLENEFGFFHIYVYLTENGINNLKEVIKAIFHYINLMKNDLDYIENILFPNYQTLKYNSFKYFYDETNIKNDYNKKVIFNLRKHGLENIFKNDVPEKFDRDYFIKFVDDNLNIENSIISLNSNYDISKIELLNNSSKHYLNNYGNSYDLADLEKDFIEQLKKFPVDEKFVNQIKLRDINNYFTQIKKPSLPCYFLSDQECEDRKEFNPWKENIYSKNRCNNNDTYLCYYANDRSINIPEVQLILIIKSDSQILSNENKKIFNGFYLTTYLNYYFKDFLEDSNNAFKITYNDDLVISIKTYKDIILDFFEKFLDKLLSICDEKEYNKLVEILKFQIHLNVGASYLNLENYNINYILNLFDSGISYEYPDNGYNNLKILEQISYTVIQQLNSLFIKSFFNTSNLYLIGDLDENLIFNLSKLVENKISININKNEDFNNIEQKIASILNNKQIPDGTVIN